MSAPGPERDSGNGEQERSVSAARSGCGHVRLKLSPLERFLLFMAKTDLHVLQFCTKETRMTMASVGAMVLITGVLAFGSSFFTIHSSFFGGENSAKALLITGAVATFYMLAIVVFDREIVSATNKSAVLVRVPFAILIGLVIAFPIELKLLEGRISDQIGMMVEANHAAETEKLERRRERILDERASELEKLVKPYDARIALLEKEVASILDEYNRERARGGCREYCQQRRQELEKARSELKAAQREKENVMRSLEETYDARLREAAQAILRHEAEVKRIKEDSHDLLSQAMALSQITSEDGTANALSWFIRIFFILFETFPVLIKLFLPYTEYHAYLDARRNLNISKIFAVANHALDSIKKYPDHVQMMETEVTDIFERVVEDPGHKIEDG